jgi:ABC-type thiamine transport system substrate-binding protein
METRTIIRMAAMTALTCFAAALSGIKAQADERTVTVCIESGVAHETGRGQMIAGQMFANIGVRIDWHNENKCPAELPDVIHIKLTTGIPANRFPGSLAFALPYEGVHI